MAHAPHIKYTVEDFYSALGVSNSFRLWATERTIWSKEVKLLPNNLKKQKPVNCFPFF